MTFSLAIIDNKIQWGNELDDSLGRERILVHTEVVETGRVQLIPQEVIHLSLLIFIKELNSKILAAVLPEV
jgi:hypothetical protein